MSRSAKHLRVAISLPAPDLAAADRLAADQDRSRSWIIAEAIRWYSAQQAATVAAERLGPSRSEQLRRDLALTASERVREADIVTVPGGVPTKAIEHPRVFATFADFAAWRRSRDDA